MAANSMSLIDEESVPTYTEKKINRRNEAIKDYFDQDDKNDDSYKNIKEINSAKPYIGSGSQSLPTNK